MPEPARLDPMIPSGIPGLDDILRGGFPQHCLSLITGVPGTGKTTLTVQFLLDGEVRKNTRNRPHRLCTGRGPC